MRGLVGRPQGGSERSFFFSALTDVTAWSEKLEMHHVDPEKGHEANGVQAAKVLGGA